MIQPQEERRQQAGNVGKEHALQWGESNYTIIVLNKMTWRVCCTKRRMYEKGGRGGLKFSHISLQILLQRVQGRWEPANTFNTGQQLQYISNSIQSITTYCEVFRLFCCMGRKKHPSTLDLETVLLCLSFTVSENRLKGSGYCSKDRINLLL